MEAKVLISAQIRNMDIHLLQVSERRFKVLWTTAGTSVHGLLYKNFISRCREKSISPSRYYKVSDGGITITEKGVSSKLLFVETTSAYSANKRFKEICRAAQDPRINFEIIKP